MNLIKRPRRNRKNQTIRNLTQETFLSPSCFITPIFLIEGKGKKEPISYMPGIFRYTIDELLFEVESLCALELNIIALFPLIPIEKRTQCAQEALNANGLIPYAINAIKKRFPKIVIVTDVALDPYTNHGHDGVVNEFGEINNDQTVEILQKQALLHAQAGADIIAPSDMMDGRIGAIRNRLDQNGFTDINIISYTAKYASCFYEPFRDAIQTKLEFGDKKTYQMNPANIEEALLEAKLDIEEGADMLMVKPASTYLDVIAAIKNQTHIPVGAYHVSGEYSMVMAAHEKGFLNADKTFYEVLLSLRRSGANFIYSYASKRITKFLKSEKQLNAQLCHSTTY